MERKVLCKYRGEDIVVVIDKYDFIAVEAIGEAFDLERFTTFEDTLKEVKECIDNEFEHLSVCHECMKEASLKVFRTVDELF